MAPPTRDRPDMPDGYGLPDDSDTLLSWGHIEERLIESLHYWVATTRPDGRPHVVPRWGVWVDLCLYYDGSPETRHARNLAKNPHCSVHLESGSEVVTLEGRAGPSTPPGPDLGSRLSAEYKRKYADRGYAPEPDAWEGPHAGGLCVFRPNTAIAWTVFPTDATRFRFGHV
jgi:hypothetical protein